MSSIVLRASNDEAVSSSDRRHIWCVVPCGGVGRRMGAAIPKQYLRLGGKTVAEQTMSRLAEVAAIDEFVVAVSDADSIWPTLQHHCEKPISVAPAGKERVHSVLNALHLIRSRAHIDDWVLVHDIARPCVRKSDIERLLQEIASHSWGGLLAAPVTDTLKKAGDNQYVARTIDRTSVWRAFTPQAFRYGILLQAIETALADGVIVTDESSAVEYVHGTPLLVEGATDNIKITTPEDLLLAEYFLSHQQTHSF